MFKLHQHNSSLPISRIPPEILLNIFSFIWLLPMPSSQSESSWDWLSITSTCRRWRALAIGTASFWTEISCFYKPDTAKAFLQRSKNLDIAITLARTNGLPLDSEAFQSIKSDMKRVNELEIQYTDDVEEWALIQQRIVESGHLTRLSQLFLQADFDDEQEPRPSILFDQLQLSAPLDCLCLDDVYIPVDHAFFSDSRDLTLQNISRHPFTLQNLLDTSENSPRIKGLSICDAGPSFSVVSQHSAIHLPRLRSLELTWLDYNVYSKLLEFITPGHGCYSHFVHSSYFFSDEEPLFGEQYAKLILAYHDGVFVDVNDDTVGFMFYNNYSGRDTTRIIRISWSSVADLEITAVFSFIIRFIQSPILKDLARSELSLRFSDKHNAQALTKFHWINYLQVFPGLEHIQIMLDIQDDCAALDIFLSALMHTPVSDHRTTAQFFCPHMTYIDFKRVDFSCARGGLVYMKLVDYFRLRSESGSRFKRLSFIECRGIGDSEKEVLNSSNILEGVEFRYHDEDSD